MTLIDGDDFGVNFPVVVIGAGACRLLAALSARNAGAKVVVFERDSSGFGDSPDMVKEHIPYKPGRFFLWPC